MSSAFYVSTTRLIEKSALVGWLLLAAGTNCAAASAAVRTQHGLHSASFNTLQGTVRVHLPDDMRQGDTISGTVVVEPTGKTDAERSANLNVLRGTVIDVGGGKTTAAEPTLKMRVPVAARSSIPIAFAVASSRQRASAALPIASAPLVQGAATQDVSAAGRFKWSPTVSQGNPTRIVGAFDGDAATTRLALGGTQAPLLAESPRQAVFQVPLTTNAGPTPIQLTEQDTTVSGEVRSVQVRLSAPKTNLSKGESTQVSLEVTGLHGLRDPLPLRLRTSGTVSTQGGSLQRFDIPPRDPGVMGDGVFRTARTLTGVAAGGFDMVAEIVWAQPTNHWLEQRVLHVEGTPGGVPGHWRVPVYDSADKAKRKFGVYFGGDKPPALQFCNWIEVGSVNEADDRLYITGYARTTDPSKEPETDPKGGGTTPLSPGPAGGGTGETTEPPKPPPCNEGDVRIVGVEEKKFTLLDGKQELFLQMYTDKDRASVAAQDFADYLKKIADLGDKGGNLLPDGDGAGGAAVGFLLKYLEQGGTVIDEVLKGKLKLAGASEFTASMSVGLRDVVATCASVEVCIRGTWVPEKRFSEAETKRREFFTKKAKKGDDEWEKISDSTGHIDSAKASKWAQDFFKDQANILKGNYDELQKFKNACK